MPPPVPPGTLLFSFKLSIGKMAVTAVPLHTNEAIAALPIRDANRLDREYLRYSLMATSGAAQTNHAVLGAVLNKAKVEALPIPMRPISEQRRIVDLLSRAENIVRMRMEAEAKAKEIIPALFVEMFGDPRENPKNLAIRPLGELISFVTSGSRGWARYYSPSGARFVRSLDVQMNSISDEEIVTVNPPAGAETERARVSAGDVLLTITGSRIGRVAAVPEHLHGAFISQHVALLKLHADLNPEFLSMFLSLEDGGQREIARLQYGQTKPGLNLAQIRQFLVPVPALSEQVRFSTWARNCRGLEAQQSRAAALAGLAFQSLLAGVFGEGR
jgi:type I restriction enzyme S subunit